MSSMSNPDIIVIGSGIGGGTTAYRLAQYGLKVLLVERGDYLPREDDNWDLKAVYVDCKYTADDRWLDRSGRSFRPSVYYNVGGASKFFGCTMFRFRERDFEVLEHAEGISPAWPINYAELEPYYDLAERLYSTHGTAGIDPTEPHRTAPYPEPGLYHDAPMQAVVDRLKAQGLRPFPQPAAISMPPQGNCIRCGTCDGYPCKVGAKSDAEISTVAPALATGNVELMTNTEVRRLLLTPGGRQISGVEVRRQDGSIDILKANTFVLAASAVNSAAMLLRSACGDAPNGVANSSGVVGRHYMQHNNSALMAVSFEKNETIFQKSVAICDYYFGDVDFTYPMGCIISLGKIKAGMLAASNKWVPEALNSWLSRRSFDWWVMSEDLPDPENRVTLDGDRIRVSLTRNNMRAHRELMKRTVKMMRVARLPLVIAKQMAIVSPSHQCGTVRFGSDPELAALDPFCRSFDHDNLYVIDSSFFPSSAAVNPGLTIAAQALRAVDHMVKADFGVSDGSVARTRRHPATPITTR